MPKARSAPRPVGREGLERSQSMPNLSGGRKHPKRGLEWSLRSMHSIDTGAQHFMSTFYQDQDAENMSTILEDDKVEMEDNTAFEIFKTDERPINQQQNETVWAALHAPLRKGIVDGKRVVFELGENVTKKPETNRKDRLQRRFVSKNVDQSSWEVQLRLYLMHYSLSTLSALFLACFVAMNAVYAGLFWLAENRCCGDPTMPFTDVFAFTVQTSTTIGYGVLSPSGMIPNFLVVMLNYSATMLETIFAGLLFTRFVTPTVNIQFSDVMTLCNVNGVPCLSVRIGNADGYANKLTDINVRLTYSYRIPYTDHKGELKFFRQTEELKLLENRRHGLLEIWSLQHVMDETSPLFGLHFEEHPANKIYLFTLTVDAVQELTKSSVTIQADYALEDILIGHTFVDETSFDEESRTITQDYSKMSETESYPVWYPARAGAYTGA